MSVRVLKFLPYFPPHRGGLENYAAQLNAVWMEKNYGPILCVVFSSNQYEHIKSLPKEDIITESGVIIGYLKDGYKVLVMPAFDLVQGFPFPKFWDSRFRIIWKKSREFSPDIVETHTRFFLSTLLGGIFSKLHSVKWVHIEHGSGYVVSNSPIVKWSSYLYDRLLGKWTFHNADKLVAISEACKNFMKNSFHVASDIEVIYGGLQDLSDFLSISVSSPPENRVIRLLFIGRLVNLKGVEVLIQAMKALKEQSEFRFVLDIAGDGEERKKLEGMVKKFGLLESITFHGFMGMNEIKRELLPNAHILVNPSLQEGLPTVVLEGLGSGRIVVATEVGGTAEISKNEDLILVTPGDAKDLSDKLLMGASQVGKSEFASKETMKKKFDWKENINHYYNAYLTLSHGK